MNFSNLSLATEGNLSVATYAQTASIGDCLLAARFWKGVAKTCYRHSEMQDQRRFNQRAYTYLARACELACAVETAN